MDEQILKVLVKSDRLIDALTKIGVAYAGYQSAKHWTGSLNALIALKLATSGNIVSGAAGVGVLAFIGLTQPVTSPPRAEGAPPTEGGLFNPYVGSNAPIWSWLNRLIPG